jgi:ribose transport system substrate-binding protein
MSKPADRHIPPWRLTPTVLASVTCLAFIAAACSTPTKTGAGGSAGGNTAGVNGPHGDYKYEARTGSASELIDISKVCGSKPMTVALADGFGGNSWRKITRAEYEAEAKKCPNIKKVLYTDANGDAQKAISDINGLVAQGVNAIIIWPDAAQALLPAVKKATAAGVAVVPYIGSIGGTPGVDYTAEVNEDVIAEGESYADFITKALNGHGNVVQLGGIPGNSYSLTITDGIKKSFAKSPGMKLLAGPVDTNWTPAQTQKVMAGLLTKYPQIDGVISDYGGGSVGAVRAYLAAGKTIPPFAADDENEFSCLWMQHHAANQGYQIGTVSSRNWISRVALRRAVAAYQGLADPEPTTVKLPMYEDSIAGGTLAPKCNSALPPDAINSSQLAPAELQAVFK